MAPSWYHRSHCSTTSPCIRLACQDVSQTCSLPHTVKRPAFVGQIPSPTAITKLMQAVISHLVPQATVQHVQTVPSVHCQRAYGVKISDGTSLVLVAPPPPMVKLLRSERASVVSEAAVLKWLANKTVEHQLLLQERTPEPEETTCTDVAVMERTGDVGIAVNGAEDLQVFLPRLLGHTATSHAAGCEFNLMRPTMGVPITELIPPLSQPERKTIDFQTGQFHRKVCKLVSPTGRFGPAFAVLPSVGSTPAPDLVRPVRRDLNARLMESRGVQSWSTAFHSMLEAVLRDGEDMQVMLGYGSIRKHFKRFQYTLDEIMTPRLVAVDAGKDFNTLVIRRRRLGSTPSPASARGTSIRNEHRLQDCFKSGNDCETELNEADYQTTLYNHYDDVLMTGMQDWSNFVFGDPLFAISFCRGPSTDFLSGFNNTSSDQGIMGSSMFSSDMIEDKATAHIRLLLYECYHTITHIAREFFRPRKDSSGRELEARKKLSSILAQLDALEDNSAWRGRRPSGEVSPAKRSKSGEKDV